MYPRLDKAGEITNRLASVAIMMVGESGFTGARLVLASELPRQSIVNGERFTATGE
jgi:hypothetical protein